MTSLKWERRLARAFVAAMIILGKQCCILEAFVTPSLHYRSGALECATREGEGTSTHGLITRLVQQGLQLSQDAPRNICVAEHACVVWEKLFSIIDTDLFLSADIIILSKSIFASCLVRTGRDADAIMVYKECIREFSGPATSFNDQEFQWRISTAQCHQRLLEYSLAKNEYEEVLKATRSEYFEQALVGAVTCTLRQGNVSGANDILRHYHYSRANEKSKLSPASVSLAAIVGYVHDGNLDVAVKRLSDCLLNVSLESVSFLNLWVLGRLFEQSTDVSLKQHVTRYFSGMVAKKGTIASESSFIELIQINTCSLDDSEMVHMDDKFLLHKLLTYETPRDSRKSSSFWPDGLVLPKQNHVLNELLNRENGLSLWILKNRAGYGSHGNTITTLHGANTTTWFSFEDEDTDNRDSMDESYLLQRMVRPLMLLRGYNFSLRIYVVCFSSTEIHIARKGLVKLAAEPIGAGTGTDPRIHMTNSGREITMQQHPLEYLWTELGTDRAEILWEDIRQVAATVLLNYYVGLKDRKLGQRDKFETPQSSDKRRESLGIPKILGLDFVVAKGSGVPKPWLVEINRFPGLEPRDTTDRSIKYQVVHDAWRKASERVDAGISQMIVEDVIESIAAGEFFTSSLEPLFLD